MIPYDTILHYIIWHPLTCCMTGYSREAISSMRASRGIGQVLMNRYATLEGGSQERGSFQKFRDPKYTDTLRFWF